MLNKIKNWFTHKEIKDEFKLLERKVVESFMSYIKNTKEAIETLDKDTLERFRILSERIAKLENDGEGN